MNRKLELVKRKKARESAQADLTKEQIDSNLKLKDSIDGLYELLNGQEQYDFDKLHDELLQIDKRLDLAPLFKSLEKSIKEVTSHKTRSNKTKIDGFSELLNAVKSLKDNPPIVNVKPNVVMEYRASDVDSGNPSYFGFLHPSGKWYVMRQGGTTNTAFRYANGAENYRSAWDKRTTLDYDLYNEIEL